MNSPPLRTLTLTRVTTKRAAFWLEFALAEITEIKIVNDLIGNRVYVFMDDGSKYRLRTQANIFKTLHDLSFAISSNAFMNPPWEKAATPAGFSAEDEK